MTLRTCWTAAGTILTIVGGGSGEVRAAGFAAARFGGEHGHVTTNNPTALYYNPAGIAFSEGTTLFIDGILALRSATWDHAPAPTDPAEPLGAEGSAFGKARLFNVFGGPMFGLTTRLGRLAVGASFQVPFGGRARWGTNDRFKNDPMFPLAADGVQRFHGIEGALTFMYFTAGIAYRFSRVSVGVTGNLIRSSVVSTQAKSPAGTGDPDVTREGRAVLDVMGYHGSFAAGVMVEAIEDRLWVGASYQAQPALGPMKLKGTLVTTYLGEAAPFPVEFHQALPDSVRVGARYRPFSGLELRLSTELTRWSVMGSQCVGFEGRPCLVDSTGSDATPMPGSTIQNLRRRWKDSYGVRGGASGWVHRAVELFGGAGLETGATPNETLDPGLADADNVAGALGGRVLIGGTFVALSYTHIQYLDRDNTGQSQLANALTPTKRPDGGGKYTQWVGLFNVNLQRQF